MRVIDSWPLNIFRASLNKSKSVELNSLNIQTRLEASIKWIITAYGNSNDGGIPAYFDLLRNKWRPSYPETTGYTIPTLINYAELFNKPDIKKKAIEMAEYLIKQRTLSGGVCHWDQSSSNHPSPIVFDTGQAIFGWIAAWKETNNNGYLEAAIKAANWLVSIQNEDGYWDKNQHLKIVKVIDARVALALIKLWQTTNIRSYLLAAQRNLEWVLSQQENNGWFLNASFRQGKDPFTHNIAYTIEGLLKSGLILDETRYVNASEKTVEALLGLQKPNGSLAATYNEYWVSKDSYTCLTGDCQISLIWLDLYKLNGDNHYLEAAKRALSYVAGTQDVNTTNPGIYGGVAGSFPIYGDYERLKFPNWAVKFFIDGLLALSKIETDSVNHY